MDLVEQFTGEDYEEVVRRFTDPFYQSREWELLEESASDYENHLRNSVNAIQVERGDKETVDPGVVSPDYRLIHERDTAEIEVKIPDFGENSFVHGGVLIPFQKVFPEIDNSARAETGSVMKELRRTHYDIVDRNSTDYLTPIFKQPLVGREPIANFEVPPDYDEEEYDTTVEAIEQIAVEVDRLYRDIYRTIMEHGNSTDPISD